MKYLLNLFEFFKRDPNEVKITIGRMGGVRIENPEVFFRQPGVRKKIEAMKKLDIVGKKLTPRRHSHEKVPHDR